MTTLMIMLMMITVIVDKELNSYMLNMQKKVPDYHIKYIKF